MEKYLLKDIDPGFSINIRSWGKFKSKMPILHECMETHMRHHTYLTEIKTFDDSNCKSLRKFGDGLRMLNTTNSLLRDDDLRTTDRPVEDPGRLCHFVLPETTRGFVAEKKHKTSKKKRREAAAS